MLLHQKKELLSTGLRLSGNVCSPLYGPAYPFEKEQLLLRHFDKNRSRSRLSIPEAVSSMEPPPDQMKFRGILFCFLLNDDIDIIDFCFTAEGIEGESYLFILLHRVCC